MKLNNAPGATSNGQDTNMVPFFRAWRGGQNRRQNKFMRSTVPQNLRGDILVSAGLKKGESDTGKEKPKANLADFRDEFILQGAFKMELTNDPSLHLRFDETDFKRPTLLILDSRTLLLTALLDLTGLMRQDPRYYCLHVPSEMKLETFFDELLLSHSLFFGRSKNKNNSRPLHLAGIDMSLIEDYQKYWSEDISAVEVGDFPIFGARLQTIHQRMTEWRSLEVKHALRHRPYRDSLPFYAFRFAFFFGTLTAVSLFFAILWHYTSTQASTPCSPAHTSSQTFLYQGNLGA
jgi:hypothetical protein